jgi:signal transduction histidine kinase
MDGIPFLIYGLEGLQRTGADPPELTRILGETLDRCSHFSFSALLAWRDVARGIKNGWEDESNEEVFQAVEDAVVQRVAILESLEGLRSDFWSLAATVRGGSGANGSGTDPIWVPYGKEPWLVGIPSDTTGESIRVSVVRPTFLLRAGRDLREGTGAEGSVASSTEFTETARRVTLVPVGGDGGESLGQTLNGLKASFPQEFFPPPDRGGVEGWFFRLLLPIILILTGFTAYLAWRDVRRETEAVRLRTQFVSSVTHELKTPLTSIRMFAETLQLGRHSGPEAQREYLDTVVHETERLSRLINNVLDFARIDRGEKTYHLASTDVGTVAREAAGAVAYPLTQGGFTLEKEIDEELPWIEADSDALTQALLNLLSNAIKFSDEGGIITLRVLREKDDILLQVEDRGPGIAPEHQEAIFRDFYRTADAEEAGIPGTGLGLSLVAHVVAAHGGSVEVESEVGRGSTFTILIPAGEVP